jgi:ferredoxin
LDPEITELQGQLREGKITRREFLRSLAILGLSLGAAETLAACGGGLTPTPYPTAYLPIVDDPTLVALGSITLGLSTPSSSSASTASGVTVRTPAAPPKKIIWYCASCGEDFSTVENLKEHAVQEHGKRLPDIQRVDQPTYTEFLVGKVERFDERNTVLSRTAWDEAYQGKLQQITPNASRDPWKEFEGQALISGAIYVDDTAGVFDPNYYGYMGHMKDTGGLYSWDDPVSENQFPVPDPAWMSARVKEVARFYGANLVGITKVNPLWVYSHYFQPSSGKHEPLEIPYPYAIVMGIEMDWKGINQSPGTGASAATALAYSRMAELSASLAKYIRSLGYPAIPCGNDSAQSIPLAIDAGLGELGRNGLLLSPEYGPRQRICKVFTSLPLQSDRPIDFGMRKFCETCHACAGACPVNAIKWKERTTEPTSISNRTGILRWPVDVASCYIFWRENVVDCSNCVAACPWALQSPRDWLET